MYRNKIFCLLFFFTGYLNLAAQSNKKFPNIIYIYADDMGYGELGCYEKKKIKNQLEIN